MGFYFFEGGSTNDTRFHCHHVMHFGLRMANIKFIAGFLALSIVSTNVAAGFQSMRPPPGYSKGAGGSTQQPGWGPSYKPAPGEFYDLDKKAWMTSGSVNLGGRELTVPVRMPLASAATVALTVATAFSANPLILAASIGLAIWQQWFAADDVTCNDPFTTCSTVDESSTQIEEWSAIPSLVKSNKAGALAWFQSVYLPQATQRFYNYRIDSQNRGCYTWYSTLDPGVIRDACPRVFVVEVKTIESATQRVFPIEQLPAEVRTPVPSPLISKFPNPLPVLPPIFNPNDAGVPQVLRVPQGSPVPVPLPSPNPDNLPQTWKTPVVDVIPSPTVDDPWRVEIKPRDIIKTSPSPLFDPLNPTQPGDVPVTPIEPDADGGTSQVRQPGLCEEYPDILACAKPEFDTPATPELTTQARELTYAPQAGWGGSGGFCPAARHLPGANVDFEFTLVCDFMSGIKPVVLAIASLAAGMIIIGARGGAAE